MQIPINSNQPVRGRVSAGDTVTLTFSVPRRGGYRVINTRPSVWLQLVDPDGFLLGEKFPYQRTFDDLRRGRHRIEVEPRIIARNGYYSICVVTV